VAEPGSAFKKPQHREAMCPDLFAALPNAGQTIKIFAIVCVFFYGDQ
jgi:hypothetical protein